MSARVLVEEAGPITTVRFDGPKHRNVLDADGWFAVAEAFTGLSTNEEIRCVAVRGTGGRAYPAGAEISAFDQQRTKPDDVRDYSDAIASAMRAIRTCVHPTVAIIEGLCVGEGLEIAACCDMRVCGRSSRFGAPINRLGLTMSHIELEPLVQLVGPGPVMEILLSGEMIDAERARMVGLVHRVFPDEAVVESGYSLVARIAAGAPLVNRWHKKFVQRILERAPLTAAEREEAHAAFETDDSREGRAAFLENRGPHFRGH